MKDKFLLTTEEKLRLLTAKDGFTTDDLDGKLPSITASDGPCGLRIEMRKLPERGAFSLLSRPAGDRKFLGQGDGEKYRRGARCGLYR